MAERTAPESEPDAIDCAAERDAARQALFESRRTAAQLAIERQHLRDAFDRLRGETLAEARREVAPAVEAALRERDRARAERDGLVIERDAALADRDRARAEAHDAGAMLHRVTTSTAWRITGPARRLLQTVLGR